MFEILLHTLDRQGFFHEGFPADSFCPAVDTPFISLLGVDLVNPSGVPVAGCTQKNIGSQVAKQESIYPLRIFSFVVDSLVHCIGDILRVFCLNQHAL